MLARKPWMALALVFLLPAAAPASAKKIRLGGGSGNYVSRQESFAERSGRKEIRVSFALGELELHEEKRGTRGFRRLAMRGVPLTSDVGLPSLPFQAVVLPPGAKEIRVKAELGEPHVIQAGSLYPAQAEPCRCDDPRPKAFVNKVASYRAPASGFRVESLGDFRGSPVSRVLLHPHRYDPASGALTLYPKARFTLSYAPELGKREELPGAYDYLVLASRELLPALAPWVAWKSERGFRLRVADYEGLGLSGAAALKDWIHAEYARAGFRYALIVGGQNRVPQHLVDTTTNRLTPSDLPYYTMGGEGDVIPEVHAGRLVADDTATVSRVLRKWMDYESGRGTAEGWRRAIGVASNEGFNPTDAEYVLSILNNLAANTGAQTVYFHQDSPLSRAEPFNQELASGAMWMTYLGHGNGTSWSSFGQTYGLADIAAIRNAEAVKPVWIDVACLNGILQPGAAGAQLMGGADPAGEPVGVAAYFGGTVLISWHPPAIFARGLAYNVSSVLHPVLGEALQAGQRYLAENYSNLNEIASNQRWYHLQGDPSMRLRLR